MSLNTQPYKGARDFYPDDKRLQNYLFDVIRTVVESFGYQEYDAPILESVDLYLAKTGEEIVNEQLYSFEDKGGRRVALRPEMTPSVSRMVAARRQELAYPLRLYSIPNLWRYERPQRGRLREHWQLNVDIFGVDGIEADHEIMLVADSILKAFSPPSDSYVIRISSRKLLEDFLNGVMGLSGSGVLEAMKLMDRKHKMPRDEFERDAHELLGSSGQVNQLMDFLHAAGLNDLPASVKDHPSVGELKRLFNLLAESGVSQAVFDTSVVRGMDYYTDIVFEVFDSDPNNSRSMFGGGRYDGLVGLFGVEPLPTVGFGMGDVTLRQFLESHELLPSLPSNIDATAILIGDVYEKAQEALGYLRRNLVRLSVDNSGRKLDAQIKSAVKSGVPLAIFIGDDELNSNRFKLRDLSTGQETVLALDELPKELLGRRRLKATRQTD